MKLVSGLMAHADTITTDDGIILGVIYYTVTPIDDEGRKASDILHEWWQAYDTAAKELIERADEIDMFSKFETYTEWCRVKGLADPSIEEFEEFLEGGGFKLKED